MTLLDFTPPAKVMIDAGFDGGPVGGYVPQMDANDARRWKAKKFNIGKHNARIELRKSINATNLTIFVALDGWDFSNKNEYQISKTPSGNDHYVPGLCTQGLNVRMSMNGPLHMTFDVFNEINQIVQEAKVYLESHGET